LGIDGFLLEYDFYKKNHMKKIVLISSLAFANFVSHSVYAQSVTYTTDNKVNKLAPVKIGLGLWFGSGMQNSVGLSAQGCVFNKLFYNAEYRYGYSRGFSNIGFVGTEELQTTQKEITPTSFEVGVAYAILDKTKEGKMKIVTDKSSTRETSFKAKCEARKIIAIGGGIFANNYVYYLPSDTMNFFESSGIKLAPQKDKFFHTNINMFGFYAGVSFKTIKKAAVSAGGYRYRKFKSSSWNFDVLSGTGKVNDIQVNNSTYKIDNAKVLSIGYRICFKADRGPTTTSVEIGKLPSVNFPNSNNHPDLSMFGAEGISSPINFFRVGFNFILYGNDRRYALKQKKK
jgi:hypothetical protein